MHKLFLVNLCAMLLLAMSGVCFAQSDLVEGGNYWGITAYIDTEQGRIQSPEHGICFFKDNNSGGQRYFWVSDTLGGWQGEASQDGRQIDMYGFVGPINNGIHFNISSTSDQIGNGRLFEWKSDDPDGSSTIFSQTRFERLGTCPYGSFDQALSESLSIFQLLEPTGLKSIGEGLTAVARKQ